MRDRMTSWLTRSQWRAEAGTIPGLVSDTVSSPGTPGATETLDDNIPDIADCVVRRLPIPEGGEGTFTCGHRTHDACLRARRDRHGPAAGCPCCGPEYVVTDRRDAGPEDNPH
eukprot:10067401-Alexandrium_andersonii.AAC.1